MTGRRLLVGALCALLAAAGAAVVGLAAYAYRLEARIEAER